MDSTKNLGESFFKANEVGSEESKKGGTDEDMKKDRRVELVIIKQK